MRLRLSNPALVPDLIGFLESRVDMVAERVSENELEMSLLGSYNREATVWRPASSSTLRTDVAETLTPTPFSSPTIRL
jgi:hypothetical protein